MARIFYQQDCDIQKLADKTVAVIGYGSQVHFSAMRKLASEHPAEVVGAEIRKLYSWSDEEKLINN